MWPKCSRCHCFCGQEVTEPYILELVHPTAGVNWLNLYLMCFADVICIYLR